MSIELMIFDWDGTLVDSTQGIVKSVQTAFAHLHWPIPSEDAVRQTIGLSMPEAITRLRTHASDADIAALRKLYYERVLTSEAATLFEGAYPLLENWRQRHTLAVATGKGRMGLEQALDQTQTRAFFAATRTVDECASKPAPDMVLSLCAALAIEPGRTLVIGDTTHDLWMAHHAGVRAVAVTTGAHTLAQLRKAPAEAYLDGLAALNTWLQQEALQ